MNILKRAIFKDGMKNEVKSMRKYFVLGSGRTQPFTTKVLTQTNKMISSKYFINTNSMIKLNKCSFASNYPSHIKLAMPNLSPTMTKGNIIDWKKKEGDAIKQGDVLASIETDKAVVDFEVNEEGYVAKIMFPAGSKDVDVGELVAIVAENKKDVEAFKNYTAEGKIEQAAPDKKEEKAPEKKEAQTVQTTNQTANTSERMFASPLAKKTAKEVGIDINSVSGSGPKGRVIQADVLEAKDKHTPQIAPTSTKQTMSTTADYEDIDLTNMRKVIAERLLFSKTNIPHFYVNVECNVDKLLEIRAELNKFSPVKISVNDIVIKAASLACMKVPEANSSWQGTFIRKYKNVDMSVAVQTDTGLITPIIQHSNLKGLADISKEMKDLAERARQQKLKPQEFQGGTFTISNMGMMNITSFSAIINPPQSCILAVGKSEKKVLFDENAKNKEQPYKVVNVMSTTLSCDHRVVDGSVAAKWIQEFKNLIENPQLMLL